jgi:N-hydroxyarylamine O-acetyltransferase
MTVDVAAYLARIGAAPDADLATLQAAHLQTVPFEDYDIHLGVPLSLHPDAVFDKVVRRRRGGFCYELNGLFGRLLRELGYQVTYVSAYEILDDGTAGPDFEHLRLLVDTPDGRVIADVGQGRRWPHPVLLEPGDHGDIRVETDGTTWTTYQRTGDEWRRDWTFTTTPRRLADFAPRCRYQQHDPSSHFRRHRLAWLALPAGRITVTNGELYETGRPDRTLTPAEELEVLRTRFGIDLPSADWPPPTRSAGG